MVALDDCSWRCVEDAKETIGKKTVLRIQDRYQEIKESRYRNVGVRANFFRTMLRVSITSVTNFPIVARIFKLECSSNLTPAEVFSIYADDTVEAHGLVEEPYRPQTAACLVELGKGTLLLCFFSSGDRFHGPIWSPELRQRSTKFIIDSYKLTVTYDRKQRRDVYSNFQPLNSDTRGCGGRFRCFWGWLKDKRMEKRRKPRCNQRTLKCQILSFSESSVELRIKLKIPDSSIKRT